MAEQARKLTDDEVETLLGQVVDPLAEDFNDERLGYGNFYIHDGMLHVEFEHDDNPDVHGDQAGVKWVGHWQLSFLDATAKPKGQR